ncbi:MAG: 23S rRNA (uracil(1939)-C(5))-methyltransferase RlmD [Spirochaetes bacterium]|nr:23S rRNA (uracil(1939)-C(5))-methyltransferase RlmD [Spirochaetota bacterium]MBN2771488.1 23S rRNA (uracil(1939)-C(5))-methyltransferase RlmD [Spirochaetota bacterium]
MGKRRRKNKELILDIAEKYRGTGETLCSHFGECGGCLFQDISYENQLKIKAQYLNQVCADVLPKIENIHATEPFGYRNRMDYVAAFGCRGFRKRGSFKQVVDITECPLLQNNSEKVWKRIHNSIHEIEDYDYLSHNGFLRYTVLRQGFFSGETMLNFVVSEKKDFEIFEKIINSVDSLIKSSSILLNDSLTDLSFGPEIHTIKGGSITESFDLENSPHNNNKSIEFTIHPNTFFQSNSKVAVNMYRKIRELVSGRVLDLYCGVGSISLFCADKCESITGVDIVEDSINSAKRNMQLNNIENASFVCADARPFIKENSKSFETLILDPPRAGINPRMYKYLHSLSPSRIIYMSCNPATFKSDYENLKEQYNLESFEVFDMFPQTPHMESLALLVKRGNI